MKNVGNIFTPSLVRKLGFFVIRKNESSETLEMNEYGEIGHFSQD